RRNVTVLLHKPVQVVTTTRDPQGRKTVFDILPQEFRAQRLLHVGRLDYFSEGLLLLTTDGSLMNRLISPRWHLPKVYHVLVRGKVDEAWLEIMRKGMTLAEGEKLAPVEVRILRQDQREAWLEMVLVQGLNRQIRRMCRDMGRTVLRLIRVRQGFLELGSLKPGEARELTPDEVLRLRQAVGLPPE
ncbi:MAG: pseudouridine synthase, partial [Humidesulfovibrio sp.]|nr:pseudouridine synthase [Humidesulfovibrio sp.]